MHVDKVHKETKESIAGQTEHCKVIKGHRNRQRIHGDKVRKNRNMRQKRRKMRQKGHKMRQKDT